MRPGTTRRACRFPFADGAFASFSLQRQIASPRKFLIRFISTDLGEWIRSDRGPNKIEGVSTERRGSSRIQDFYQLHRSPALKQLKVRRSKYWAVGSASASDIFSNWLHGFSLFLIWIRRQMQGTISVSVRKSRAKPSRNQQEDNVQRCAGQKEASTSSWKLSITKNPQKFSRWEPRFPRRVLVGMPGTGKTLIRKPQRERRIAFLPHVGIDSSNVCRIRRGEQVRDTSSRMENAPCFFS